MQYDGSTGTLTIYYFAGGAYEVQDNGTTQTTKKYYSIAGMRVAMDDGTDLVYFASDNLSSTSIVMDASGTLLSEQRYLPFGEVRADVGTAITQTDFGYTGQRNLGGMGLMDYNARFYSPLLGRFIQPDSIVPNPGDSQAWNRYSYVGNNPIRFVDPTGHLIEIQEGADVDCPSIDDCLQVYPETFKCGAGYIIGSEWVKNNCRGDRPSQIEFRVEKGVVLSESGTDIESIGKWFTIGYEIVDNSANAMVAQPFTFKSIKFGIKNIIGGKYNVYNITFLRGFSSGEIRNIGRTIGDDLGGPGFVIGGLLLTVLPNIIENDFTNASIEEQSYEFAVDMAGFAVSEAIGDVVQMPGSIPLTPWVAVPLGFLVDYEVGVLWDNLWYPDK